jgi:hypothetical protein
MADSDVKKATNELKTLAPDPAPGPGDEWLLRHG